MNYTSYRDTIIMQQEQHLLTIAKSVSKSLELFMNEKADSIKNVAGNSKFQEQLFEFMEGKVPEPDNTALTIYYETQNREIEAIYLLDKDGVLLYQYPPEKGNNIYNVMSNTDVKLALGKQESHIGDVHKDASGEFVVDIIEPVFYKRDFQGILIVSISLETMYKSLVQSVKVGEKGYVMVKDRNGTVLMHPVKEQVGTHVIAGRKENHPDLDYSELEDLIERQMVEEEGIAIYHSYWWPDNKLVKVKKLNGFASANIGQDTWIVATPMSYEEIAGPIEQNLFNTLGVAVVFLITFTGSIFIILRIQKNKEELEIETIYLKELNKAAEELRKSELQLQHSMKLQTIGTLTGGIAHEFNNLLTPILGYSELILKDLKSDSELYEGMNEIYESSVRAKELIEQILIFSRRDNISYQYQSIQVKQFLKETVRLIKSLLPSTIEIIDNIDEDCGHILANSTQMHQVILNLCTNAYHAMREHGGILEVSAESVKAYEESVLKDCSTGDEEYVKICVKDTGCGMNKETMDQIFDPFFTTKMVGEGTGLGLSVVHGIILNHNGKITVESQVGIGSIFTVYLQKTDVKNQSITHINNVVLHGNERILLVDDEPRIVQLMKKTLELFGYQVTSLTSSVEALKVFKQNHDKFDLVITDQAMPNMRGTELAKKIKSIRPQIKIMLVTGFADEEIEKYTEDAIIDIYLLKPVFAVQLSQEIRRMLLKN